LPCAETIPDPLWKSRGEVSGDAGVARFLLFVRRMTPQNPSSSDAALQKGPDQWKTGDEPMTAAQRSYLDTLARETGAAVDESLTKAEASKRIDELRDRSPRLNDE